LNVLWNEKNSKAEFATKKLFIKFLSSFKFK